MTVVSLFAKAPIPGQVKTRLASDVGLERAVACYRRVGLAVCTAVAQEYAVTVWYDPPGVESMMRSWLGPRRFRVQRGRDLGARMHHAFEQHFTAGDAPVIAIGADCPGVDASVVRHAVGLLERHDVAIGPAVDGGYYLLGLNAPQPDLFDAIPWSTSDVFRITADRCRARDLSVAVMPPRRDIDTLADVEALGLDCP
jgi:rSAM/selenodomain-associated transferase 1